MKKLIIALIIVISLCSSISAYNYGFNIGAIQDSISDAIELENKINPDWFQDLLDKIYLFICNNR